MSMKMARASNEEIEATMDLAANLESLISYGCLSDGDESVDNLDEEIAKLVRNHLRRWSLQRIVFGYQVLVDNCCDPDESALEWRKDIRVLVEAAKKEAP